MTGRDPYTGAMNAFWRLARRMLRYRAALVAAMVFALLSAGGLGVGLVTLSPMLEIILQGGEDSNLRAQAIAFNADSPPVEIPAWVIDRLPVDPFHGVVLIIVVLLVLTVLGATANFCHEYLAVTVATRAAARIRQEAFGAAIHLPLSAVITRGPAEFVARIIRDTVELQRGFMILTSRTVAQVTKGAAAFIAAIVIDWRLTIAALVVAPPLAVLLRKLGKRIRRGTRGALEAQEDLLRVATESLQGLRTVKTARGEWAVGAKFRAANRAAVRGELRVRTARALAGPLIEALAVVVIAMLALIAAREILLGRLSVDRFVLALGALGIAGASFKPLTGFINEIQAASAPAARLESFIDLPPEASGEATVLLPRHHESIVFENVRVRYPGASEDALRGVDLHIRQGEMVAFVGPNGCGKTTLLSLVPRLLVPTTGRVLVDGCDLATVRLGSLRRQIGFVTQETTLFRGTIASNIAFGMRGVTRDAIMNAARLAHADAFIRALPEGYDATIAEHGASLSGGQRQRLSIARAILRDPAILILDEATSQIDAESERQINGAIATFRQGRTVLVIAHRLSTVLAADRIVVMERGRVIDDGTHGELLERCPLYRRIAGGELVGAAT